MKNVVAILLLFVYTSSITGFGVKKFYCCNKLQSISAILLVDKSAGNDKSSEDGGCCNTKYSFFKVKDNHVAGDAVNAPVLHFCYLHLFTSRNQIVNYPSEKNDVPNLSNAPPLHHTVPAYIFNCVFRV